MYLQKQIQIIVLSIILFSGSMSILTSESYAESKSIESIITLETENDRVKINVQFIDVIGQTIGHVNYDITARYNSEIVLEDTGVHVHSGFGQHVTVPIDKNPDHDDEIKIELIFRGIGLNEPYGGPVGKVFEFSQNLTLNNDLTDFEQLQQENIILKQENTQMKLQIEQLQKRINDLNAIIQEQISVIYKWIMTK